ncbi:MAG TPA: tripartite tricarboxylate transporter substrate-binding protein [Beijerinckiaceae bacterium]|jgi:tripartite-type tricarboxylate transporter receptor subunit TctC|nr:tripartite tricarboxylate transporter substrate-binding protein [Beijerinckiaceae bacterium]
MTNHLIERRKFLAYLSAAPLVGATGIARAQNADLFARKTITVYIGNTTGGSYDLYGRMVARFLGKHLPGKPNVVAENMPGAGTIKCANFIYSAAPKDGTALGIVTETLALEQALANPTVQYDATKFTWIGRAASSNNIHMMWHTSKVQSIEDAKLYEAPVAGTGPGNIAEEVPTLLNSLIGTKFKIISGYPASNEAMLAMERGEVEGAGSSWAAVKTEKKDWLAEKKIKIILQDVPERAADLPDVPTIVEVGRTPDEKQLLGLYASGGAIGRAFLAPPGLSDEVTQALRTGFNEMVKDPEMIDAMKKADLDLEPLPGETLQKTTVKILDIPDAVKNRAKAMFGR